MVLGRTRFCFVVGDSDMKIALGAYEGGGGRGVDLYVRMYVCTYVCLMYVMSSESILDRRVYVTKVTYTHVVEERLRSRLCGM